jgi:hypothetical protein
MDSPLHVRGTILMGGLIALDGRDVVAAFVKGGFRVARRERGLALLVRGVQVVVVPESGLLAEAKLRALIERAEISEKELLSWLARTGASSRSSSGFHQKTPIPSDAPPRHRVDDAVKGASDARARADAAHVDARNALASSHAVQESLAKWREALRELDEREQRELRSKKR